MLNVFNNSNFVLVSGMVAGTTTANDNNRANGTNPDNYDVTTLVAGQSARIVQLTARLRFVARNRGPRPEAEALKEHKGGGYNLPRRKSADTKEHRISLVCLCCPRPFQRLSSPGCSYLPHRVPWRRPIRRG